MTTQLYLLRGHSSLTFMMQQFYTCFNDILIKKHSKQLSYCCVNVMLALEEDKRTKEELEYCFI